MKTITRNITVYTVILYFLPFIIPGFKITGGIITLIIGGLGLTVMFLVIKPILNIISFPINFLTMGLFSLITNGLILYLLTVFISGIQVNPFSYYHESLFGIGVPNITFNLFFAYIYTAFVLSFIDSLAKWLVK